MLKPIDKTSELYRILQQRELESQKKCETIKQYSKYADIFIETGTFKGYTVNYLKDNFKRIISIELHKDLFDKAKNRFKELEHITILQGDSGEVLKSVLITIHKPAVFWLDGHYSGSYSNGTTAKGKKETPIMEELECILSHPIKNHIILIDDARLFTGQGNWIAIKEIKNYVFKKVFFTYKTNVADSSLLYFPWRIGHC